MHIYGIFYAPAVFVCYSGREKAPHGTPDASQSLSRTDMQCTFTVYSMFRQTPACIFTIYPMCRQASRMHIYDMITIKEHDMHFIRIFTIYYTTGAFFHFHDTLYENEASAMLRQALACIFMTYSTSRSASSKA